MRKRQRTQIDLLETVAGWFKDLFGTPPFLAIDLGSSNIRIYLQGKGIVSRQKVYIVKNIKTGNLIAFYKFS